MMWLVSRRESRAPTARGTAPTSASAAPRTAATWSSPPSSRPASPSAPPSTLLVSHFRYLQKNLEKCFPIQFFSAKCSLTDLSARLNRFFKGILRSRYLMEGLISVFPALKWLIGIDFRAVDKMQIYADFAGNFRLVNNSSKHFAIFHLGREWPALLMQQFLKHFLVWHSSVFKEWKLWQKERERESGSHQLMKNRLYLEWSIRLCCQTGPWQVCVFKKRIGGAFASCTNA